MARASFYAAARSITELMLNAVALNAILDVDEWHPALVRLKQVPQP